MVYTRNQKRQYEVDLEINDDYTSMNVVKKKKNNKSTDNNDNNQNNDNNENNENNDKTSSDEGTFSTETDTEEERYTDIVSNNQTEESDESDNFNNIDEIYNSDQSEKNKMDKDDKKDKDIVFNKLLNENFLKNVIQETLKQIVNGEDKDNEKENNKSDYNQFKKYIESIYTGDFFQRVPIEDQQKKLKNALSNDQIKELNNTLKSLQEEYEKEVPSIIDILKLNTNNIHKKKLLEKIYHYTNSEILSSEYNSNLKTLLHSIKQNQDPELNALEEEILLKTNDVDYSDDYKIKILKSKMCIENKIIAYKRNQLMETYEGTDSSEYSKYKNWMDTLLSVPFGKYIETPNLNSSPESI